MSNTQKVFDPNAVRVQHINPSIMEGERGHSSILGPQTAIRISRFAPEFTTDPSVSGSFKIPSVLTCNPGVFIGSPQPDATYQWQGDGVDIDGETSNVITTSLDFDQVEITCDVTVTNELGTDTASSNGITASLIEPVRVEEFTFYAISGLTQQGQINMMTPSNYALTGLGQIDRIDAMSTVSFVASGMWVEDRLDTMSLPVYAITGLHQEDTVTGFDLEAYAVWQPAYDSSLTIVNHSAEDGDMTGWTVTTGSVSADDSDPEVSGTIVESGSYFFNGDNNPDNATMNQVVTLAGGLATDIDNDNLYVMFSYWGQSRVSADGTQMRLEFLDASDVSLGFVETPEHAFQRNFWEKMTSDLEAVPADTRKIRVIMRSL